MVIRARVLLGAGALVGLAACASIVGLDSSDPMSNAPITGGTSGTNGTSGGASLDGGITTEAGVSVSADSITFARASCGISQKQTISVTNSSSEAKGVDVSLPVDEKVFSIEGSTNGTLHIDVPANDVGSFVVQAKGEAAGSSSADIQLKVGEEEHHVNVSLETAGGVLVIDPPALDFGFVRVGQASPPQKVTFRNDGTDKIQVRFGASSNFQVSGLPIDLEPGKSATTDVVMLTGPQGDAINEALQAQVDGLCGDAPKLTLKGQHLDKPYTIVGSGDFGDLNCGANPPAPKTITLSNYTTSAKSFTAALGKPAPFTITALNGTIPAGNPETPGVATLIVTLTKPEQIPQDLTDNLTFVVDTEQTVIPLHVKVRGARLAVSATTLKLNKGGPGGTGSVKLTNSGNVNACVRYQRTNDTFISEDVSCSRYGCSVRDDEDQVNAGQTTDWTVEYFSGSQSTTITANITRCSFGFGEAAPLCGAAPSIVVSAN